MIYVFCQNHGIAIGSYLRSSIQAPDFAVEIVEILIGQHNAGVAGAKNLIASIAAPDSKNANDERIFYNHLTEGFGVWFAHKNLGASIRVIEEASNPVRSRSKTNIV